jgi:hypothetical protein
VDAEMKYSIGLLLFLFLGDITVNTVFAFSETEVRDFEIVTISNIREARSWIRKAGTPEAQEADSKVKLAVNSSLMLSPYVKSDVDEKIYEIVFPTQLSILVSYLSETDVVVFESQEYLPCREEYGRYLRNTQVINSDQFVKGAALQDYMAPELFFASLGSIHCKPLAKLFPIKEQLKPLRNSSLISSIYFMYFHELGHIAKQHKPSFPESLSSRSMPNEKDKQSILKAMLKSREQEAEADNWAVDNLIEMGVAPNILLSTTLFQVLLVSSGLDCIMEPISSHPFAVARLSNIMTRIEYAAERKYNQKLPTQFKKLITDIRNYNNKVEMKLSCNPEAFLHP